MFLVFVNIETKRYGPLKIWPQSLMGMQKAADI